MSSFWKCEAENGVCAFGKDQHARREIRLIQMSSGQRARDEGEKERARMGDNEERARRCWDQDEKQRGESKAQITREANQSERTNKRRREREGGQEDGQLIRLFQRVQALVLHHVCFIIASDVPMPINTQAPLKATREGSNASI